MQQHTVKNKANNIQKIIDVVYFNGELDGNIITNTILQELEANQTENNQYEEIIQLFKEMIAKYNKK